MRKHLVCASLLALASSAVAQPLPDLPIVEAKPDVWGPLRAPFEPAPPALPIDHYVKRVEEAVMEGQTSPKQETTRKLDAAGRVLEIHTSDRSVLISYDAKGRPLKRVDGYGKATYNFDFGYDDKGRLSKLDHAGSDIPAETTVFTYDAAGNLATRAETSAGKTGTWRFLRSKHGTLVSIQIDGADGKKTMLYEGEDDAKGNVVHTKSGGWMAGEDLRAVWDKSRRLTQLTTKRDKQTEVMKLSYDGAGRITRMDTGGNDDTQTTKYVVDAKYDAAGRLTSLSQSRTRGPLAPLGRRGPTPGGPGGDMTSTEVRNTTYTYDKQGRLVADHEDAGGGGGGHGFNSKTDTKYEYDAKGRLTKVTRHAEGYPPLDRTSTVTFSY